MKRDCAREEEVAAVWRRLLVAQEEQKERREVEARGERLGALGDVRDGLGLERVQREQRRGRQGGQLGTREPRPGERDAR